MAPKAKSKALAPAKGAAPNLTPPAAPQGPSVDDLIAVLDRHVKARDDKQALEQALQVSEQILALDPKDPEAIRCKVVALVQLARFKDALLIIGLNQARESLFFFEKAYCLYKENRVQQALNTLKAGDQNAAVIQLEAQIYHKMGDYGACISSYEKLFYKHKVDADEVKTNLVAAYVSGGRSSEVPALMDSLKVTPKTSFDLAYNAACALIELREFVKAEELLLLARRIGQEMLIEDDYPQQDIDDELAPIAVQLAYVQQMQGRAAEAMASYSALLKQKPDDAPSLAVASNNLIALRGAKELFDSLKKFDKIITKKGGQFVENLDHKLSARQKEAMSFNRFLLLLYSSKFDQARELVPLLQETFPNSVMPTLLAGSLYLKEGKPGKAEEIIGQYADAHPSGSAEALLVRAQAAAAAGQYQRAAESLEKIGELKHKPGVVATLVSLKERAGDVKGAEAVLDAAVQHWQNSMLDESSTFETVILEAAADFKLKHNNLKGAATLFQQLAKSPSPVVRSKALHGLICSTAHLNSAEAEGYAAQLPPLPGLSSVDVAALEQTLSATPMASKRARAGEDGATNKVEDKADKTRPKKKRKRKPLYPKGFDPENPGPPPDPERWLPRRERSTYKPKKKDKRNAQIRGAQGAVSKDSKASELNVGAGKQAGAGPGKPSAPSTSAPAAEASRPPSQRTSKKKGRR